MGRLASPAALAALAVSACVATPGGCDPAQADFFSGIACQSSGAYRARNDQLQSSLAAARYNLGTERSRANAAAIDAGAAQAEQDRTANALAGIRRQNVVLRSRLDAAARRDGADRGLIDRQRGELRQLEQDREAAQRNGADREQLREIERRQRALLDALSGS